MKILTHFFCIICVCFLIAGCSEDGIFAPPADQDTPAATHLNKQVDQSFTGTSKPTGMVLDPGTMKFLPNGKILQKGQIAEWYDEATDPRVTGFSYWLVNKKLEADMTGTAWGSAELIVDNNECAGKWEISWHGVISKEGVVADAVGTGKEGDVKGMVAKWTYTMDFSVGRFYTTSGYIY